MNGTKNLRKEREENRTFPTLIEYERYHSKPVFKIKYIGQALFFNHHFLVMILLGFFGVIFTPPKTSIYFINESIDFLNALMLGVGISGVICWVFVYKLKKNHYVSSPVWVACYLLLNICHIFSVLFVLGFFGAIGIEQNGNISALICGNFFSTLVGIVLSIKYTYKS